jgi:hypothetical protein
MTAGGCQHGFAVRIQFITPCSPEQNGMIGRVIRTLK